MAPATCPVAAAREPEPASARVAQARSRAGERGYAQRQLLRPLGVGLHRGRGDIGLNRTIPHLAYTGAAWAITVALAVYARGRGRGLNPAGLERGRAAQAA